jgi:hypothetical protein
MNYCKEADQEIKKLNEYTIPTGHEDSVSAVWDNLQFQRVQNNTFYCGRQAAYKGIIEISTRNFKSEIFN